MKNKKIVNSEFSAIIKKIRSIINKARYNAFNSVSSSYSSFNSLLNSKLPNLDEKEILSVLKSEEKVDINKMINLIVKSFIDVFKMTQEN